MCMCANERRESAQLPPGPIRRIMLRTYDRKWRCKGDKSLSTSKCNDSKMIGKQIMKREQQPSLGSVLSP
jgi:hypothetical protein